jgi:hypothetical protein
MSVPMVAPFGRVVLALRQARLRGLRMVSEQRHSGIVQGKVVFDCQR